MPPPGMAENTQEIKVVVKGDASGAVGALGRVKTAVVGVVGTLNTVKSAVSKVMSALAVIGMAMQGVQLVIEGFKKLHEWMNRAARETAKFRWSMEMRAAANETARMVGYHERIVKLMKDELDTLAKQQKIQDVRERGRRDYEDGKREADRARQLFEAKTPEEEQALRDQFAAEDERRARNERRRQRKSEINRLDEEESVYSSKAKGLRKSNEEIDTQLKAEKWNLKRANGKEEDAEPIRKRIEALEQRKKANEEEIAQLEKETKFRRDQIAALKQQKDYGGPTAGEWNRKAEAKKRQEQEAAGKAKREQRLEDARLAREKEEALSALDPSATDYENQKKEVERTYEVKAAELKVSRAENPEDKAVAEEELKAVNIRQEREQAGERQRLADDWTGNLAAVDDAGRPKDRLTAMGLGSGAAIDRTAQEQAKDVKTLVSLVKEQIQATRENNQGNVATYAP